MSGTSNIEQGGAAAATLLLEPDRAGSAGSLVEPGRAGSAGLLLQRGRDLISATTTFLAGLGDSVFAVANPDLGPLFTPGADQAVGQERRHAIGMP